MKNLLTFDQTLQFLAELVPPDLPVFEQLDREAVVQIGPMEIRFFKPIEDHPGKLILAGYGVELTVPHLDSVSSKNILKSEEMVFYTPMNIYHLKRNSLSKEPRGCLRPTFHYSWRLDGGGGLAKIRTLVVKAKDMFDGYEAYYMSQSGKLMQAGWCRPQRASKYPGQAPEVPEMLTDANNPWTTEPICWNIDLAGTVNELMGLWVHTVEPMELILTAA